jgi:hypothetical protein
MKKVRNAVVGGLLGGVLGAWTMAWTVAVAFSNERGWLFDGLGLSDQARQFLRAPARDFFEAFWASVGLPLPSDPLSVMAVAVMTGAVSGCAVALLATQFHFDPRAFGLRSMLWSIRGSFSWPLFPGWALVAIGFAVGIPWLVDTDGFLWLGGLLFLLWLLVLLAGIPIAFVREGLVSVGRPHNWWKLKWPGARVVAAFLGLECVSVVVGLVSDVGNRGSLTTLIFLNVLAIGIVLMVALLQVTVLLGRSTESSILRALRDWTVLGPWVSYHFWLAMIPLALAGPYLAAYVFVSWLAPPIASALQHEGLELPAIWQSSFASFLWVRDHWVWLSAVPAALVYWLGAGRVLAHAREISEELKEPMTRINHGQFA